MIKTGYHSQQGPRDYNEDNGLAIQSWVMNQEVALLGICDGMGGDDNGARAAAEVTTSLSGFMAHLPGKFFEETDPAIAEEMIKKAVSRWHVNVLKRLSYVEENEHLTGLTTTLIACFMWYDKLVVWWLGDSRAYRFRDGRLERLTTDHSKVEQMLGLPEEVALEHPEKSKMTRFLRPGIQWEPEIRFFDWQDGDVILVASDGVSDSCRSWELEAFMAYWLVTDINPKQLCEKILAYIENNVDDNATLAIAMRGSAKPFSDSVATIELPTLVKYGLKKELIDALSVHPSDSQEWLTRISAPWHNLLHESLDADKQAIFQLVNSQISLSENSNGDTSSPFVEVADPSGRISRYPMKKSNLIVGRPFLPNIDLPLVNDEMVSPNHVEFKIGQDYRVQIHDLNSDNGVWLRIRKVDIPMDWLWGEDGISVLVGRHQVTIRGTLRHQQVFSLIPEETMEPMNEPDPSLSPPSSIDQTTTIGEEPGLLKRTWRKVTHFFNR